ncbi:hypothetical protein [Streptomyces sp. NPDC102409]|uniref:hypothetical protein n=1 Tax=Streptomyces sp. NPDC102409 TaxID=3366172 RepID=UPI003804D024
MATGLALVTAVSPAHAAHAANSGAYGTTFEDGDAAATDDFGDHFGELGNSLCRGCGEFFGFVEFHRGDTTKSHDGGAHHLHRVMQGDGVHVFGTGTRIHLRSRTVSLLSG